MQYLEDIEQEQFEDLYNWQFSHMSRIHYEPWERKARKLRSRRSKEIRKQERHFHKQIRRDTTATVWYKTH